MDMLRLHGYGEGKYDIGSEIESKNLGFFLARVYDTIRVTFYGEYAKPTCIIQETKRKINIVYSSSSNYASRYVQYDFKGHKIKSSILSKEDRYMNSYELSNGNILAVSEEGIGSIGRSFSVFHGSTLLYKKTQDSEIRNVFIGSGVFFIEENQGSTKVIRKYTNDGSLVYKKELLSTSDISFDQTCDYFFEFTQDGKVKKYSTATGNVIMSKNVSHSGDIKFGPVGDMYIVSPGSTYRVTKITSNFSEIWTNYFSSGNQVTFLGISDAVYVRYQLTGYQSSQYRIYSMNLNTGDYTEIKTMDDWDINLTNVFHDGLILSILFHGNKLYGQFYSKKFKILS